jgi:hypothetical protein
MYSFLKNNNLQHFSCFLTIFFSFVILFFVSISFAECLLYCYIFTLYGENSAKSAIIFAISLFFDIYTAQFIGVSFLTFMVIPLINSELRSTLLYVSDIFKIYYFFLLLCFCKLVSFAVAIIFNKGFDFYGHISRVFLTIAVFCVYCFVKNILPKMKRSYARR